MLWPRRRSGNPPRKSRTWTRQVSVGRPTDRLGERQLSPAADTPQRWLWAAMGRQRQRGPAKSIRRFGSIATAIEHKLAPSLFAFVPREPMAAPAVRRADFLMALAYATDLATGHSRDFALRSCVLAMRFADVAGLDQDTRRRIYHQALLRYIGCNADTHLLAAPGVTRSPCAASSITSTWATGRNSSNSWSAHMKRKFPGAPPEELEEAVKRGLAEGPQVNIPILSGHCEVAQRIAERIGLPEDIRESLGQIYERWDGKGLPRGLSGNAVKFPVRVVTMAQDAIALNDHHGFATMKEMIAKRAGGGYEPELVDTLPHAMPKHCSRDSTDRSIARRSWRWSPSRIRCSSEEACEEAYRRDRRHDRHADAVHVRSFARGGVACRRGGQADGASRVRHSRCPARGLYARHRRA